MKSLTLLTASALALTGAACSPKTPPQRAALDCPAKQGQLTRSAAAADGKSCVYLTPEGAEIQLQLVSTAGRGPDAVLSAIEADLLDHRTGSYAPTTDTKAPAAGSPLPAKAERSAAEPKIPAAPSTAESQAEKAVREAEEDSRSVTVRVDIGGEGKSHGGGHDGDTTRVSLPGIRIVANEHDDTADVRVGPLSVKAGDDGVDLRVRRDVRLRGEAFNPQKRGIRATFIYTGKDLPAGLRFVGYEAAGPKAGPITVATVRSKLEPESNDSDSIYPDVKRLVRKNGGV